MKYSNKHNWAFSSLLMFLVILISCDLDIEGTDSVIAESSDSFNGVENVQSSLDNLYNDIYSQLGDQGNFFALNEVSTDEQLVPTRGTDWGDNGIWRSLHAHTWDPSHAYILNVWNQLNRNVFRASEIIDSRSNATSLQNAEARFLRAFSMYFVLDLWGIAPFRGVDEGADVNPMVLSSNEAFDFITNDLITAIPDLPQIGPGDGLNRATMASGQFLLAKILLNSERYTGSAPDYQEIISLLDNISSEGFALQEGYFEIFKDDIDNETIWWASTSVGNRIWNGLHYNQNTPDQGGGWNGFSTLAEFYDMFEGDPNSNAAGSGQEERRGWVPGTDNSDESNFGIGFGFLVGQQYIFDPGTGQTSEVQTRQGDPLVFTKEFVGLSGNLDGNGIRVIKYNPANGAFNNHEIVFRYADAHLMKAEALMRSGQTTEALAMVNELRELRKASALTALTEDELLDERGRELYVEFWRRNDMIRFDQYTRDWEFKNAASVGNSIYNLYPIPIAAILSNPNLQQNPGY